MRAILINPHTTSVTEVQIEDELQSWYTTLTFNEFKVNVVQPVYSPWPNHSLWVDEEGLFKARNRSFELIGGYPDPLFGCGLIIGEGRDGTSRPCTVMLADVQTRIVFGRYMVAAE